MAPVSRRPRSPRSLTVALGILLLVTTAAAQPNIVLDPPSIDFGQLRQHESRENHRRPAVSSSHRLVRLIRPSS